MRRENNGKSASAAFLIGAAAGAIAVEALVCASYPQMKRTMMRKGVRALRVVKHIGERYL